MLTKGIKPISADDLRSCDAHQMGRVRRILFGLLILLATAATFPLLAIPEVPGFAQNNGFVLVLLGLVAVFAARDRKVKVGRMLAAFAPFVFVGAISTIGMAFVIEAQGASFFWETPINAIGTGLLWIAFDAAIVFYLEDSYATCTQNFLDRILDILLIFVLVVGGVQAGVNLGTPGFSALFDAVDIGGWFSVFKDYGPERLSAICSEPSAMSMTLGLFCLPYCYCRVSRGEGVRYGVAFVLLVVLAFMTRSTTVYVTVAVVLLSIIALNVRRVKREAFFAVVALCGALAAFSALFFLTNGGIDVTANISETLKAVLEKITDVSNQSTAYRNSTIINDIEIFKEYPLFGVGDGNQGFFYTENLPTWVLASGSTEALSALSGSIGVLNGGAFTPSLISGYGIVGCVLFGAWIVVCVRTAINNKARLGHYYEMFVVAMFASIPICWMAVGFQGAPVSVFLIFCLPALGGKK